MLRYIICCWKVLKQYLSHCNIHGVRYLVSENTFYIERFFWLFFCILSWWGCTVMIKDSICEYIEYPVDVTTETLYINWETPFPSVAICIKFSIELKNKYNINKQYAYKKQPLTLESSGSEKINITAEELLKSYQSLQIPCKDIFANCSWNNMKFDCCSEFKPLNKTGVGYCYVINSRHIKPYDNSNIKFWINRTTENGNLVIDLIANKKSNNYIPRYITAYILDNLELPNIATLPEYVVRSIRKGYSTRTEFSTVPIYNEQLVQSFSTKQRNCRFSHETDKDSMFQIYSRDSCAIEIYIQEMIKYCGCVSFYYLAPAGTRTCNLTELQCLSENKKDILSLTTIKKKCYSLCEENTINVYHSEPIQFSHIDDEIIRIDFMSLARPFVQYRRYVVHSLLDVIVAVGSALGLFMGASILSFFEIPYWLFLRRDQIV
ncbi:sodium channel protein Nach [Vespula pensylvanica]|uniref:sodium channel protein Nach n=1 Tax=Vespula pensylvanica TaxID=30213 RepID=UPI001CBA4EC0|nr:sodium channel protein Nach [Vespula pensylvanica]